MTESLHIRSYRFDCFTLDLEMRSLSVNGRAVKLNAKAFDILRLLVELRGTVVSKELLLETVWPHRVVEEGNLSVHIFSLRKVLKNENPGCNYIETVPGSGYRFIARVREHFEVAPAAASTADGATIGEPEPYALAVLPFSHTGDRVETEYFAAGFTESLINSLSALPALRVLSANTVAHYKDRTDPIEQIGQALGMSGVVAGEIREQADHLVVEVQLIQVEDGQLLWEQQYEGSAWEIFKIQQSINLAIAEQLRLPLTTSEQRSLKQQATSNVEAYRHYLKGQYWFTRRSCVNLPKAIESFREAIKLDPTYALALVSLADSFILLSGIGCAPCSNTILPAQRALEQALATDPELAAIHSTRGLFKIMYRLDWTTAETDFLRAIEMDPAGVRAYSRYAMWLKNAGRFSECQSVIQRAFDIDPLSFFLYVMLGDSYYLTRDYARAVAIAQEVLVMEPEHWEMSYLLGKSWCEMGEFGPALQVLETMIQHEPHPEVAMQICVVLVRMGKPERARELLQEMVERSANQYVEAWVVAAAYAAVREFDAAFDWLDRALEERNNALYAVRWDPRFDSLRQDPRLDQVVREIGYTH